MQSEVLKGMVKTAYRSITIIAVGILMRVMYISAKAIQVDEETMLECVGKMSRGRAIIMGDLHTGHKARDTQGNARGF